MRLPCAMRPLSVAAAAQIHRDAEFYYNRAAEMRYLNRLRDAEDDLARALGLNPDHPGAAHSAA